MYMYIIICTNKRCYVMLYYSHESFSNIQSKCYSTSDSVVIFGDLNSRMGDLSCFNSTFSKNIHYQINPDHRMNENGRTL